MGNRLTGIKIDRNSDRSRGGPLSAIVLFVTTLFFWIPPSLFAQGTAVQEKSVALPMVVPEAMASIESAEYSARLEGLDLVEGSLKLDVIRRGQGTGILDWSDVRIAINQLQWQKQKEVLSGTTAEQRMVVLTDEDSDLLSGTWSAHGKLINQQRIFDLIIPAALNSRIVIQVPPEMIVESSQGVLRKPDEKSANGFSLWTLELGNLTSTTLKIGETQQLQNSLAPRYEIETEYRARRDGIFLRADLAIEGTIPRNEPLRLIIPENIEIQSVTLYSGSVQVGNPVPFQRSAEQPDYVHLSLEGFHLESRFSLRLRAFQQVTWGEPHQLARVTAVSALETLRTVVVRIEPPLQLQSAEAQGMLQMNLSSDEISGEVWRYEAREPDSKLTVTIDLPQSEVIADIQCLTDVRRSTAWAAAVISMHVDNGSRFESVIQLPEEWKLVSVAAGDAESRLTSWSLDQRNLHVSWQNPMTSMSHRQLRIFAKTPGWKTQSSLRLPIPQVRHAGNTSVLYQVLVPGGTELQVVDGEGWRLNETTSISQSLLRMWEVTERVADPLSISCVTLRSTNEIRSGKTMVNLLSKTGSTEATVSQEGGASSVGIKTKTDADESQETVPSPILNFELASMVGPSVSYGCVHQAVLKFDNPVPTAGLNLKLPLACKLSALEVDGRSTTVFRQGEEIPLPAEIGNVSTLRITYVTDTTPRWLSSLCHVPIPRTSIPVSGFLWTLDLPRDQLLSRIDLPNVLSRTDQERSQRRTYFGPLARQYPEEMFNPLSLEDWRGVFKSGTAFRAHQPVRRSVQFVAPTVGSSVEFVVWDSTKTRNEAWVALLACLMIGTAARLFHIGWLRQISIVWLMALFSAITLAPPAWGLILGGMLSGSLLSILLPRRWMQSRDFLLRERQDSLLAKKIVTTGAATACLWLAGNLIPEATSPSVARANSPASSSTASLPLYLIQSAKYELSRMSPSPQIRATFQVLTRPQENEIFIRLPLQDVVFASAADCLVNGEKQTLIPSLTGDAMVVGFKSTPQEESVPVDSSRWIRSEIQLDFMIRPALNGKEISPTASGYRAVVPNVLDSRFLISSSLPSAGIRRWGQEKLLSPEGVELDLGGIGQIQINPDREPVIDLSDATAVTLLHVSPLRFKGQTRIVPGPGGWPALLPLTFPPGCVISSMTGGNVIDSITAPANSDSTALTVRLRTNTPALPVVLNYELPATIAGPSELIVPVFPLWNGTSMTHLMGVNTLTTATVSLVNSPGVVQLPVEQWPAEGDSGRNRPSLVLKLTAAQPVNLSWTKQTPVRTGSVSEALTIQKDGVEWTAQVPLTVTGLPIFRQQFRIDPTVRIESVTSTDGSSEGRIRYSRSTNLLTVFIPGGQLGERTMTLKGRMPLSVDHWWSVPLFEVLGTNVLGSELTIVDKTNWNVDLEAAQGVPFVLPPSAQKKVTSDPNGRTLGVFQRENGGRPERFRVTMPIEATRADSIVSVQSTSPEHWDVITTFHLTAIESSLKKAVFRIPQEFTGIRIRTSNYQYTSSSDPSGTLVVVKIPERFSSAATITISARMASSLIDQLLIRNEADRVRPAFPLIEIQSAQKASQFVLVDPKAPFVPAPTGSLRVDAAAFPSWAPPEWIRAVREKSLDCYQLIRKDLSLVGKSVSELSGTAKIQLDETVVWPLSNGDIQGLSRIWLTSQSGTQLPILHDPELKISSVLTSESGLLSWKSTEEGSMIELPEGPVTSGLLIRWRSQKKDHAVPLLNFGPDHHPARILAAFHSEDWRLHGTDLPTSNLLPIWIARWQALLQCVHEMSGPIAVDSELLKNVRMCQQQAAALLGQVSGGATPALMAEFDRLTADWNAIKDDLVVSGESEQSPTDPFENTLTEMLTHPAVRTQADWLMPVGDRWDGHFEGGQVEAQAWKGLWIVGMILLAAICVSRFSSAISRFRDQMAAHPGWSFTLLGLVWWIWLSPSFIGLMMILAVWGYELVKWSRSLLESWEQKDARTA